MASLLLCPSCGGGLPTRRGMRRHLETHGWDPRRAFSIAAELIRHHPPAVWRCPACSRRFATTRGLIRHARSAAHGMAPDGGTAGRVLPVTGH